MYHKTFLEVIKTNNDNQISYRGLPNHPPLLSMLSLRALPVAIKSQIR